MFDCQYKKDLKLYQGRVHFALMDQMKLMSASGMKKEDIKKTILANVTEIIDSFGSSKRS